MHLKCVLMTSYNYENNNNNISGACSPMRLCILLYIMKNN